MLQVTATEFKTNLGKYLDHVANEDIQISKNGKPIAILKFSNEKNSWVDNLLDISSTELPGLDKDFNEKDFKMERLWAKYEGLT